MSINLKQIPIFHDIASNQLWIPFALSATAYLLKKLMPKIFPRHVDHLPFADLRRRIRLCVDSHSSVSQFEYRVIFITIPESLFLSLFIISILQLKTSTSYFPFRENPQKFIYLFLVTNCLFAGVISLVRDLSAFGVYSISCKIQDPYPFLAILLKRTAQFIATYEIRYRLH